MCDMKDSFSKFAVPEEFAIGKYGTRIRFSSFNSMHGCDMSVLFDSREPVLERFSISCIYRLRMDRNVVSGNHYHNDKDELFIPESGSFRVTLLGAGTLDRPEEFLLESEARDALFVPKKVAHCITALEQSSMMLVLATGPETEADSVKFDIAARVALARRRR